MRGGLLRFLTQLRVIVVKLPLYKIDRVAIADDFFVS
jgi:hypothetical protein